FLRRDASKHDLLVCSAKLNSRHFMLIVVEDGRNGELLVREFRRCGYFCYFLVMLQHDTSVVDLHFVLAGLQRFPVKCAFVEQRYRVVRGSKRGDQGDSTETEKQLLHHESTLLQSGLGRGSPKRFET